MSKLIKNELTKIFHKKAIYIILIITLIFMILDCVLTRVFENTVYYGVSDEQIEFYENELKNLDKNNPDDKDTYIMFKSQLETAKIQKQYDQASWQAYVISNRLATIMEDLIRSEGTKSYNEYKKQYDDLISKLNQGDWRHFVDEELKEVNTQISELQTSNEFVNNLELENLNNKKQVLTWRLDKNIPYGSSEMNTLLEQWESGKRSILQYNEDSKSRVPTHEEKIRNQENISMVEISELAISEGIPENSGSTYINELPAISTDGNSSLIEVVSDYSIFIVIAIVMIAGTIVSEEFNKGTIKLLLVRPYKRLKIVIAKFITCLIILAFTIIVITLLQYIIGGFTYGFDNYNNETIIYNFNTNSTQTIGLVKYWCISTLALLPTYLLIMTLAFALSIIFNNSPVAIALPLLGMMGSDIINQLVYNVEKAKFLIYFVTPNWNFTKYLFGRIPTLPELSIPFSITICAIYFAIMAIISLIVFKKRDIKNV